MLVGITQQYMKGKYRSSDSLETNYIEFFNSFGVVLIPVSNSIENINKFMKKTSIKAVIISGGDDIASNIRDKFESRILEYSIKKKIPVFGICRGMHLINHFFGGSLIKRIKHHVNVNHKINLTDQRLKNKFKNQIFVNSYHNQGIKNNNLSKSLRIFAESSGDGIIEGVFHPDYPVAGVQWHPERKSLDININKSLINYFLKRKLYWETK